MNYPCVAKGAQSFTYRGHSSHVMNIRWSADENVVVSVGGKDRAIFQWEVNSTAPKPDVKEAEMMPIDEHGIVWDTKR